MQGRRILVFVAVLAASAWAQTDVWYGEVTGDKVRVRGGPADLHAVLGEMRPGAPVRVTGIEGDWLRVEIPGGFPVYVSRGEKDRPYLSESEPGEGVVLVDDLMLRGTPSMDHPPIGRLRSGDRVVVLDEKEGWARIASPPDTQAWIHGHYVKKADDQEAAAKAWAQKHEASRKALLESGGLSKELVAREQERRRLEEKARAAFASYEVERAKAWNERDVASVRQVLTEVRDEMPAGHPDRARAEALLQTLDEWEKAGNALAEARTRFEEASREAQEAEARYASSLKELRQKTESRVQQPGAAEPASPYAATGFVGRAFPVAGIGKVSYTLEQGGKNILYLESARYDLSEYEGRLIGILQGSDPASRPGVDLRVVNVTRLEILYSR